MRFREEDDLARRALHQMDSQLNKMHTRLRDGTPWVHPRPSYFYTQVLSFLICPSIRMKWSTDLVRPVPANYTFQWISFVLTHKFGLAVGDCHFSANSYLL